MAAVHAFPPGQHDHVLCVVLTQVGLQVESRRHYRCSFGTSWVECRDFPRNPRQGSRHSSSLSCLLPQAHGAFGVHEMVWRRVMNTPPHFEATAAASRSHPGAGPLPPGAGRERWAGGSSAARRFPALAVPARPSLTRRDTATSAARSSRSGTLRHRPLTCTPVKERTAMGDSSADEAKSCPRFHRAYSFGIVTAAFFVLS